jgi:putative FmdB family regulatory protein
MPLYEFRCEKCANEFEALCRDTRAEGVMCPGCGAPSPARLISRFAVSRQLTPCGSSAAEAASSCGFNPQMGGCGRCGS